MFNGFVPNFLGPTSSPPGGGGGTGNFSLPIVRYVYLVQDASDAVLMGGAGSNVYTTFQTAYTAANALQVALGGTNKVVIMVGNVTAATVGDLTLAAIWNENVWVNGLSTYQSVLGNIIGDNAAGNGFSVGRGVLITQQARFSNITVGNISTSATGVAGNSGTVGIAGSNAQFGNITTTVTNVANVAGNGGQVRIQFTSNSFNLVIGNINTSAQGAAANAGLINITCGTLICGTITTAVNNIGGTISISPSIRASISTVTVNTLSAGTTVTLARCALVGVAIILKGGIASFTDCFALGGTFSVTSTAQSSCIIANSNLNQYVSNTSVATRAVNSAFLTIDNLGKNSVLDNVSVDNGGYGINGIGLNCKLINTSITPQSGLSIDNAAPIIVFATDSIFTMIMGANITISLLGGVTGVVDSGGGVFTMEGSQTKQAALSLNNGGGGANVLTINNPAIGETYTLYITNVTGIETFSIPGAVYSGGAYVPTAVVGALDRLIVTYDGVRFWVSTAGTAFA